MPNMNMLENIECLLVVSLMLSINADVSQAVECYQCSHINGTGSPDCVEPFPNPVPLTNITILECEKYCIKSVTMETTTDALGKETSEFYATSRSCGSQCIEACYKAAPYRAREICTYCCEGELCNSANFIFHPLTLVITMLLMTMVSIT